MTQKEIYNENEKTKEHIETSNRFFNFLIVILSLMAAFYIGTTWDSENQIEIIEMNENFELTAFKSYIIENCKVNCRLPIKETIENESPEDIIPAFDCNENYNKKIKLSEEQDYNLGYICQDLFAINGSLSDSLRNSINNFLYFKKYEEIYLAPLSKDLTIKSENFKEINSDRTFTEYQISMAKLLKEKYEMKVFEDSFRNNIINKKQLESKKSSFFQYFTKYWFVLLIVGILYIVPNDLKYHIINKTINSIKKIKEKISKIKKCSKELLKCLKSK